MDINILGNSAQFMALVFGLVEFLKKLGLKGETLTLASMALGVAAGVVYQVAKIYPQAWQWIGVGAFGLAVGLAASGLYDFANARWPKQ